MDKAKKILLIRFSSIGDIVLTTPVIRCLKTQVGAELHFLCKKAFATIVEANPHIDKVYTIEKKVGEVVDRLKAENYDHIVDLHKNLRSLEVRRQLKAPSTAFNKLNLRKWLLVNFKLDLLPDQHIVDRYLETVVSLGVKNDGQGLDYFIPAAQQVDVAGLFKQYRFPDSDFDLAQFGARNEKALGQSLEYIAFAIGAAHATKRLPVEKIIEICRGMEKPVILLGGRGDRSVGEQVVEDCPEVINACGELSLHQSASLVRQAYKVITHDTGMMHMAAAFQKEIISIWGNTVPAFGMFPYYPEGMNRNTTVEVANLSCRPCSKIGFEKCPKGHFRCMQEIDTEQIIRLANS